MSNETVVKTMELKHRRKGEVRIVIHDRLLVDDGVDSALPRSQQNVIRQRCGVNPEFDREGQK